jgi:hypothetical protein
MADLVKSVEFLEVDTSGTEVSYELTMGQDYSNCVPFFSSYTAPSSEQTNVKTWDCYFSGTTESGVINFRRYYGGTTGYIKCYVVEFEPSEVYVEQGSFSLGGTQNITTTSGFNSSYTGMVTYWRSNDTNRWWDRHLCRGRVTGNGALEFYRSDTSYSLNGHWFIFEARNGQFTVEHRTSSSNTPQTLALGKTYDPLKTFVIGNYAGGHNNYFYASRSVCRLFLYLRGDVRWDKASSSDTVYVAFQIIEFQDNKVHVPQAYLPALSSTSYTWNWNHNERMNFPTTSGFSMAIKASPYFDYCPSDSSAALPYIDSTIKLDNEYQVSFAKGGQYTTTYPSFYVVDWKGIEVDTGSNPSPIDPTKSFAKSVQNTRIETYEWQGCAPLTKGQNIDNCVIFASQYANGAVNNQYAHMCEVYLSDTGTINVRRVSTSYTSVVDVSVVEFYPDQVRVQSGSFNYGSMTSEANITLDRAIDTSKTFLLAKWTISSSSTYWDDHNMRCRIIDSNTLGFYQNASSGRKQVSWFIAEDITEDNSCFEVTHWNTSTSATYPIYVSGTKHFPYYNTFIIASGGGGHANYFYPSRSCFRAYYDNPTRPLILNKYSSSDTIYYNSQIVIITRSGRHYVQGWYPGVGGSSQSTTTTFSSDWVDRENITVFNSTMQSFARVDSDSASSVPGSFWSGRITDYENRTVQVERGDTFSCNHYLSFNIICWAGGSLHEDANGYLFSTKSLVQSVEYLEYTGTGSRIYWWLNKGQNPRQCVPFATWSIYMTDNILQRAYKGFYFEYDYGPPYRFLFQAGTSPNGNSTTGIYIVEFDSNQVKVQQGSYGVYSANATVTIEEVDLDKAFLVFYAYCDPWTDDWDDYNVSGQFENSTTLRFRRTQNVGAMHISWYVVECLQDQWSVQHLYSTQGGGSTSYYNSMSYRVPLSRMWQFNSYAGGHAGYWYPSRSGLRTWPRTDLLTQIDRSSTSDTIYYFSSEVVKFNENLDIRTFYDDPGGNFTTTTLSFNADEDFNEYRAIVFNPTANNMSRCDTDDSAGVSETWIHQKLIDFDNLPVKVQLKKGDRGAYNSYTCSCVTSFPPYNKYYFEGTVSETRMVPAERRVCAYRTDNNDLVDWTVSISGTGYFYLETPYEGSHYVVCFDDDGGKDYNHLIYSDVYPAVISGTFAYYEGLTASGIPEGDPEYPYAPSEEV